MPGAHLALVSLAEHNDQAASDDIHRLNGDKDRIANHHCVNQEKERRSAPEREGRDADAGRAALLDQVDDLRKIARDH